MVITQSFDGVREIVRIYTDELCARCNFSVRLSLIVLSYDKQVMPTTIQATDVSGVFDRPDLIDYILVAEHQQLDLCLRVYVGRLEIGLIGVHVGSPVYADMPGATGNTAFALLARLSNARIVPSRWKYDTTNIDSPWRELVGGGEQVSPAGRTRRLADVRSELRELDEELAQEQSGEIEREVGSHDDEQQLALKVAAELLDWRVVEVYLRGDFEHARRLAGQRERLQPGELLPAANLERLRLRLLEDEFVAGVAEVRE
jgi:hypothetical protein